MPNPEEDPKPKLMRAPRRKGRAREIKILGHRDMRGPDNSVLFWVDTDDRLHISVYKTERCYRFERVVEESGYVEVIAG